MNDDYITERQFATEITFLVSIFKAKMIMFQVFRSNFF